MDAYNPNDVQDSIDNADPIDEESEIRERFLYLNARDEDGDVSVQIQEIHTFFRYSGQIVYEKDLSSSKRSTEELGRSNGKDKLLDELDVSFYANNRTAVGASSRSVEDFYTTPIVNICVEFSFTFREDSTVVTRYTDRSIPSEFTLSIYEEIMKEYDSLSDFNNSSKGISGYYNAEGDILKVEKNGGGIESDDDIDENDLPEGNSELFVKWLNLWLNDNRDSFGLVEAEVKDIRENEDEIYIIVNCNYDDAIFNVEINESKDSNLSKIVSRYGFGDLYVLKEETVLLVHSERLLEDKQIGRKKRNIIPDIYHEYYLILNPDNFDSQNRSIMDRIIDSIF